MENNLGKRIKAIRKQLDKNQADFSKALDIAYPTLSKYENGHREPELATLIKIAELGNVSLNWFLTGEGPKHRGGTQEEQAAPVAPKTPKEEVLLEIFRGLSNDDKLDVIFDAGNRRLTEALPLKESKKGSAAQ